MSANLQYTSSASRRWNLRKAEEEQYGPKPSSNPVHNVRTGLNARKALFVGKFGLREVFFVGKLGLPLLQEFALAMPLLATLCRSLQALKI